MRQGVFETPYSFLECVYTAVNDKKPSQDELLLEYRRLCELDEPAFAIASQENPSETPNEIHKLFQTTPYLDPRKWCTLLEKEYVCKIITFSKKREEEQASLVFPHHSMAYLQYQHSNPAQRTIVCVYEHYGVDMFRPYPRCELIVFIKPGHKLRHLFGANTNIVQYQQDSLSQFSFYRSLVPITNMIIPFQNKLVESQFIDSYGKTRALRINDGVNRFILLTSPLPPLDKPIIPERELYQNNVIINLVDLLTHYSLNPTSHAESSETIEVICQSQNVVYTLKLPRTVAVLQSLQKIPKQQSLTYPHINGQIKWGDQTQKVSHYFTEKRLALCMVEYFIYFYSYWNRAKGFDLISNVEYLRQFMNDVVIEKDILYDVPHTAEISIGKLNDYKFVKNMNFIVSNEETRQRLLYVLRNRLASQYEMVRTYYSQNEMFHFYEDRYHYACDEQKHTIVTTDLHTIIALDHQIYDHLLPTRRQFISRQALGGTCLVTEHETQESALRDAQKWNPKADSLYVYNSKTDIRKRGSNDGGVLVYQKDGQHYLSVCVL